MAFSKIDEERLECSLCGMVVNAKFAYLHAAHCDGIEHPKTMPNDPMYG